MESDNQAAPVTPAPARSLAFEFRGDGMEYFKIWIVNILLTIVTLGIYSAWATVRNNRYFYSNLYLDDTNFRYLAEPLTILKGRLIAIAAFIVFSIVTEMLPIIGAILAIALLIAIPYFINQSMKFKMRMSAYKNIQFRFHGSYGEAAMVFFVWPILGMLTLGILYPLALLKMNEYLTRNSAYGTTKFEFNATYGQYGMVFLIAIGIFIVCGIPMFLITMFIPQLSIIVPFAYMAVYFGVIVFFMTSMLNIFYSSLSIKGNQFSASLTMPALTIVLLKNIFFIVITAGLYLPAAKVRMTKYIAENITLEATDSLDNFAAAEKEEISALGDEFGQAFDFGI